MRNKRALNPRAELSPAHSRHCFVKHAEQRAALFSRTQRFAKLKIAARCNAKVHKLLGSVRAHARKALYGRLIGVPDISEKRAERLLCKRKRAYSERTDVRAVLELICDNRQIRAVKFLIVAHFADASFKALSDKPRNLLKLYKISIYEQFHGMKPRKLRDNVGFAIFACFVKDVNFAC